MQNVPHAELRARNAECVVTDSEFHILTCAFIRAPDKFYEIFRLLT